MIKKIFLLLFVCILGLPVFSFEEIEYKNIKNNEKIKLLGIDWTRKVNKNDTDYYVKKVPEGLTKFSEFYSPQGEFLFSAGTNYEFIEKGRLIGYSNSDLKFYEFGMDNGLLVLAELNYDDIKGLFPDYTIIKISDFSKTTNSLKMKKSKKNQKIILLNDTDRSFDNYCFYSNNAKYDFYELKGVLNIKKKGLIQFARFGENSKNYPWYVLLVR